MIIYVKINNKLYNTNTYNYLVIDKSKVFEDNLDKLILLILKANYGYYEYILYLKHNLSFSYKIGKIKFFLN